MLRIFVPLSSNQVVVVPEVKWTARHLEDTETRLTVRTDPERGFYFEVNYSIKDREPLILRSDIANITAITHRETTDDVSVVGTGCGNFTCEYGTVKISEAVGQGGKFEIFIVSSTVVDFNATMRALRNGELKKDGEELTAFEILQRDKTELEIRSEEKIRQLCNEVGDIKNRNLYLETELEELYKVYRSELEGRDQLREDLERVKEEKVTFARFAESRNAQLLAELSNLKNRNLWQRIWNK